VSFAYDDVPYDTEANSEAHPVAMATIAMLHGLEPAAARNARVLEIGCGDGENIVAAATYLPEATFVGFDLAAAAIEAGNRVAGPNVRLFAGDILEQSGLGAFEYVIAHGLYSWVPPHVRVKLLALIRESLAPNGIAFLSMNALPRWEYRRALRELALDRVRDLTDPGARVRGALALVDEIAQGGKDTPGYFGRLAADAAAYRAHVEAATPPEAPFSRYVFHDLLADGNDPIALPDLEARLGAAGLRLIGDTPLSRGELPFRQVLVHRDDAPAARPIAAERVNELWLWADFTPSSGGFKTSTGALVRPPPGSGLERATALAPGFVRVKDLGDPALAPLLLDGFREGVFTLRSEPPPLHSRVADHVRARAAAGRAILTNAIHRSFRVPPAELAMVASGSFDAPTAERFRRHLFLTREQASP